MKIAPEFYDLWHQSIDENEYRFFKQYAQKADGPILELGCGTGRLLLPLLQEGYAIEGIDHSRAMLDHCMHKAQQNNLQPTLHHQAIESMQLNKKYALIFSALETFQHIAKHSDAFAALQTVYNHLAPEGTFVVCITLPWLYALENAQEWRRIQEQTANGDHYSLYEKSIHDALEQLYYQSYRIKKNDVIVHEYETIGRWYSPYEFKMLLADAGFKDFTMQPGYMGDGPFDTLLFTAYK